MLFALFSTSSAYRYQIPECQSMLDLTNKSYEIVNLQRDSTTCYKVRGSFIMENAKDLYLAGYMDNKLTIYPKRGVAAFFAKPYGGSHSYYIKVYSEKPQKNVIVYGSLDIPYNKKVLVSRRPYIYMPNIFPQYQNEAYIYLLGPHNRSELTVRTTNSMVWYQYHANKQLSQNSLAYVGTNRKNERKGEFSLVYLYSSANSYSQKTSLYLRPLCSHNKENGKDYQKKAIHASFTVKQNTIMTYKEMTNSGSSSGDSGSGSGSGSGSTSGQEGSKWKSRNYCSWAIYYIIPGAALVLIVIIVVIACICAKASGKRNSRNNVSSEESNGSYQNIRDVVPLADITVAYAPQRSPYYIPDEQTTN